MILVRQSLGDQLRRRRLDAGRTLREVSKAARVSLGYLSEVERGRKEPSSELLAAICAALGVPLSELWREVADDLALRELLASGAPARVVLPRREVLPVGGPGTIVGPAGGPGTIAGPAPVVDLLAA